MPNCQMQNMKTKTAAKTSDMIIIRSRRYFRSLLMSESSKLLVIT